MGKLVRGKVFSGVGEGAHYVELYGDELTRVLGSPPYPGTLNVLLERCFYELVERARAIVIQPPRRGLGAVYVYRGTVANIPVLVLKPAITVYECRVVELVSSVNLREKLGLRDGDFIEVDVVE